LIIFTNAAELSRYCS